MRTSSGGHCDDVTSGRAFAFLVVGRSIDQALFFGGPQTLAELDLGTYLRAGVEVFLAASRPAV